MRALRLVVAVVALAAVGVLVALALEPLVQERDHPPHPEPRTGVMEDVEVDSSTSVEGLGEALVERIGAYIEAQRTRVAAFAAEHAAEHAAVVEVETRDVTPTAPAVLSTAGAVDWDAVAECERPGEGWNANHGPIYEGKLGFARTSWDAYRDQSMPDNAGNATREQQIAVAERIRTANGGGLRGSWGCWEYGGVG